MDVLKERIRRDGVIKADDILKVDGFLNHQVDTVLIDAIGLEFARRFAACPINKVLTIEASGIAIGYAVGQHLGVPVVFAKKAQSINLEGDVYTTRVESFTHKRIFDVIISKKYVSPNDHVLIVDDFLANGCALDGLIAMTEEAGATIEGVGIVIEKGFQQGGRSLRERNYRLESLAIIESMDPVSGQIVYR
ncbi:MAG: xanthine phosphoribosyltransferase [Coriobacteriales bacterium]|jgi:xanthine phosphoribosyltransferase|nr:xanthine phosphoribosyltransferase [Coriobacteriales bacterium]